jgi:hypothetical protein
MPDIAETDAWACLREDWGEAYRFEHWPASSTPYHAFRRDDDTELSGKTPDELRERVRADYSARPVPRQVAP